MSTHLKRALPRLTATLMVASFPLFTLGAGSPPIAAVSVAGAVASGNVDDAQVDPASVGIVPTPDVIVSSDVEDPADDVLPALDGVDPDAEVAGQTVAIASKTRKIRPVIDATPSSTPTATTAPTRTAVPATATPAPTTAPAATATPAPATSRYQFGTLLSDASKASQEYAAGVRVVHLELGWDAYEPQDGVFSATYAAQARQRLQTMQAAGVQVVLGIGLQYPPSWVYSYANSRYVNQYGVAAGPVNLTFNQALREKAEQYIARVNQDLGLQNFTAVRIGSGGLIESLYPGMDDGTHGNSYWSFDAAAQGGAGRPASVPAAPFPGWRPGDRTYNGQAFSTAQVQQWYDWYLGAMVDGITWQIATYKRNGFAGDLQVLMPGLGSRPSEVSTSISNYLNGTGDGNHTMGRAAAWHLVVDRLTDRRNVVLYVSSLADGSGSNNVCQSTDSAVSLSDSAINTWSAARWVSYNANRYGLAKNGENPGRSDTNGYGKAMMDTAARQMQACGFQGMYWAHDKNLYDGVSGITLADYAAVIARYQ